LSFFTAIVFPFGSTPCLNCLINTSMSFFIVWWHMLDRTERFDLILPYIPCQNHLHQVFRSSEKLFVMFLKYSSGRLCGSELPSCNMLSSLSYLLDSPSIFL
jgi:hypothetical protein